MAKRFTVYIIQQALKRLSSACSLRTCHVHLSIFSSIQILGKGSSLVNFLSAQFYFCFSVLTRLVLNGVDMLRPIQQSETPVRRECQQPPLAFCFKLNSDISLVHSIVVRGSDQCFVSCTVRVGKSMLSHNISP